MITPNGQQLLLLLHFDSWCNDSSRYGMTVNTANADVRQSAASTAKFGNAAYYNGSANGRGGRYKYQTAV